MNITRLENSLAKHPSTRRVLLLSAAYWLQGMSDNKPPGENAYWQKAYHTLSSARSELGMGYELLCMLIFINTELENFDLAYSSLARLGSSKNYIKNNNPFIYKVFLFLSAFIEIRRGKNKKAVKFLKQLDDYAARKDKYTLLMMGIISVEIGDAGQGAAYLSDSYGNGCRSVFLYAWLTFAFSKGAVKKDQALNTSYLRWALIHKVDAGRFAEGALLDNTAPAFFRDPFWRDLASHSFPQSSLRHICVSLMRDMNYTASAFEYYKRADALNLELPDLYHFLIKAAYHSNVEKISRQAMERYLKKPDLTDVNVTAYVYHIMLANRNLYPLVQEHREALLDFTARCLENSAKGRFFNSLYAFYIVVGAEYRMPPKLVQNAANMLGPILFTYRVKTAGAAARVVYVTEKQWQGVRAYKLADGAAMIEASDHTISVFTLSEDERKVVDVPLQITRLVGNADMRLYKFFYNQGMRGFPLLASMARALLQQQSGEASAIPVYIELLACKEISEHFANQVKAALALALYRSGNLPEARAYFADTDENTLPDSYIEDMTAVFLASGDLENTARLVSRKNRLLSDKSLFGALKQLSRRRVYDDIIAEPAFRLLKKAWYDKTLLDIVMKCYKGVQNDWQDLSRVLSSMSITDEGLDSLILEKAVYMHRMSDETQRVFARAAGVRLAGGGFNEGCAEYGFMYFCVHEMLTNAFRPLYETIDVLEKIYLYNKDVYLAYALSHVYLNFSIITVMSEQILADACAEQEKSGVLFPVFKTHQDKFEGNAYIKKKQPFIYRTLPGKNVFLNYRVNDGDYNKQRMRYLRFGLYACCLSVFYGETIKFFYSEELPTGSITTPEAEVKGAGILLKGDPDDPFYVINNAVVFEQMFQYARAEEILSEFLKKPKIYNARLMN